MARAVVAVMALLAAGCGAHYRLTAPDHLALSRGSRGPGDLVLNGATEAENARIVEEYRARLDARLAPAEAVKRMRELAFTMPASSRLQHLVAYGALAGLGGLEIQAPVHLKHVIPVPGDGVRVARYRAEADGSLRRVEGEAGPLDAFAARYKQFRLLFLTIASTQAHREIFVGAASRAELRDAMRRCAENGEGEGCFALEKGAVIAAEIPVTVNGKRVFVPWNATAREAAGRDPIGEMYRGPKRRRVRWEAGVEPGRILLLGGETIRK